MGMIEDLQEKISTLQQHIAKSQKMLQDHDSGEASLSLISQASAESSIEKNQFLLKKYNKKLQTLTSQDKSELDEMLLKREEIVRSNYFKYQSFRIKRDQTRTEKEIQSALSIYDELPEEIKLEDDVIFEIGKTSSELFLDIHTSLDDELLEIKNEFLQMTKNCFDETNEDLKLLNYRIPIIVLRLRTLINNLKENLAELKMKNFSGMPKFQDWWIQDLWENHQAYIGLYKWKNIVLKLLISCEQKYAFEIIFRNWILIKKILNVKGKVAFCYNKAFDDLLLKYTNLQEEKNIDYLESIKCIVMGTTNNMKIIDNSLENKFVDEYTLFKRSKKEQV